MIEVVVERADGGLMLRVEHRWSAALIKIAEKSALRWGVTRRWPEGSFLTGMLAQQTLQSVTCGTDSLLFLHLLCNL